jgi:hypothetical protein
MIPMPSGLLGTPLATSDAITSVARDLVFWADHVTIPFFGLQTMQALRYGYGAPEYRPTGVTFQTTQINFNADELGDNYQLFYNWIKMIINNDVRSGMNTPTGQVNSGGLSGGSVVNYEPYQLAYRSEIVCDIQIQTYSQTGDPVQVINLREAFPTGIAPIDLDWEANNTRMHVPVSFAFTDLWVTRPNPNIAVG